MLLTSVVDVNSGNAGWTIPQVIDGLETAFANLGWHSGTAQTGVPCWARHPGQSDGSTSIGTDAYEDCVSTGDSDWQHCGGPSAVSQTGLTRYFDVISNGSASYYMCEKWTPSGVDTATDTVTISWNKSDPNPNHSTTDLLTTENKVRWAPGGTDANLNIGGLTLDTDYWIIRVSETEIKLAASQADAQAGNAVSLTSVPSSWTYFFRRPQDSTTENRQIDVYLGDILNFNVDSTDFYLWDDLVEPNYHADNILTSDNCSGHSYRNFPSGMGTSSVVFISDGWEQSEDEPYDPTKIDGVGYNGKVSYAYGHKTNTNMKGTIRVLPRYSNNYTQFMPYWKYDVPASGSRSALKLRFNRIPWQLSYSGKIGCVSINSVGSGWGTDEVFTVPGEMIGGVATTNDITFGTNVDESSSGSADGTPSIDVTDIGAGTNFFQRHPDVTSNGYSYAVLRLENDSNKKFGVTYWTFGFHSNRYQMFIRSGIGWSFLNRKCGNFTGTSEFYQWGTFQGDPGLDLQSSQGYITFDTNYDDYIQYAKSSTSNAWPLSIRTYSAQSPQDDDFSIIQFTHLDDGHNIPTGSFTLHKGTSYGVGVSDLDHNFMGSYTRYYGDPSEDRIDFTWIIPGYGWSSYATSSEPVSSFSQAREFSYGWARQRESGSDFITRWSGNINTQSTTDEDVVCYFRDNNYDNHSYSYETTYNKRKHSRKRDITWKTDDAINYYKPIKGIPIQNLFAPVPYYMPDDFVLIQAAIRPASTKYYPGDTIVVSASEKYIVIVAGVNDYSKDLNGISNSVSKAMLLCGKIPN